MSVLDTFAVVKTPVTFLSCQNLGNVKLLPAKSLRGASWFLALNGVTSEQFFKDVDIPFDCLFIVARSSGHVAINLTEVYRVDASLPITESPYCTWTARKGLSCPEANFFRRRSTLRDLSLRVIWPDRFFHFGEKIVIAWIIGYVPIVRMDDHKGNKLNDSWTGMIGDISTGVAHVAVDPTGMKTERTMVVDFTMPLFTFKEPDSAFSWGRFLAPFSRNLWWAVATTLLMIIVFLSLIHHVGRVYGNAEAEGPEFYSLYNCVIYVFGIFCQQGNEVTPRSWSCRIVYWMAYFTSMILLASYSGTLISFLTIKHNPLPFSDVTGLLQDKSYQVGMLRSYSQIVTKSKDVPLLLENTAQKLLDKMSRTKRNAPSTALEGLSLVCTSKYALLITASALTPLADDLPCGVVPLPRFSFEIGMSYIIAGAALTAPSSTGTGIPPVDSNKFSKLQEGFIKVGFKEVAPIVTLLGAGAVLGCVILLVECCLSRSRRRSCQYK
ncbi:hypothetical protein ANN_12301 [Periplaneta americana]|uniref:Ionotropic glutamate receptor C-terminal domain-containing protein n=1 Tax=Periplaneta americana TaxID=6978 RepID=A0ABQ8TGS8_PERAM|nr:hypothetical protein ANN_12301 [Periplaneta americana]